MITSPVEYRTKISSVTLKLSVDFVMLNKFDDRLDFNCLSKEVRYICIIAYRHTLSHKTPL